MMRMMMMMMVMMMMMMKNNMIMMMVMMMMMMLMSNGYKIQSPDHVAYLYGTKMERPSHRTCFFKGIFNSRGKGLVYSMLQH